MDSLASLQVMLTGFTLMLGLYTIDFFFLINKTGRLLLLDFFFFFFGNTKSEILRHIHVTTMQTTSDFNHLFIRDLEIRVII